MFSALKKIASQTMAVAYFSCRRYNYKCFTMMSDAKDFGKAKNVQPKVVHSQEHQKLTEIQEKQKASAEILNNQKPNKMVGEDPNGNDSQENPKADTNSNSNIESQEVVLTKIKKPSNIKKRRNRQKFNIDNPPKIEETKLESKNQNKKDDKKKQETKDDQKKQNKFEEFKKWITKDWRNSIGFSTLFVAVIGLILQMFGEEMKQRRFEKEMMDKYSSIQVQKNYVDSPIQEQIVKCLNHNSQDRIKLIVGVPGIGKTTSIKKVLSDMKKSGVKVFYFSFGDKKKNKTQILQLKKQFYALMLGIMKQYAQKPQYSGKKVKVVLDDINKLGYDKQILREVMKDLYLRISYDQIDINCISSQSNFILDQYQNPEWKSYRAKFGRILIIQNHKNSEAMKQFHLKIIQKKFGLKIKSIVKNGKFEDNPLVAEIANHGLTTRDLEELIDSFLTSVGENWQDIQTERAQQLLKKAKKSLQQITTEYILSSINQIKENDKKITFLSNFLFSEEQLTLSKCKGIIVKDRKYQEQFKKAIQKLQHQNTIIFCRPRSRFEANIFRDIFEDLKKKSSLL